MSIFYADPGIEFCMLEARRLKAMHDTLEVAHVILEACFVDWVVAAGAIVHHALEKRAFALAARAPAS